ncbi:uncharacterized protein LOC108282724 [Cebus imitator]|uniref:uncharacterized protein LOC108282724 n=1 Tax=Cebus imitator TaxID=2715852 RepID=UPI000809C15D|nr:uncharacterized protein LOC108282724 [Cebus imitator]
MQTQPGARWRSLEGGSERHVSLGLSASGEMERPVGAGVDWSTGRARALGRARAGERDGSWATAPPWRGIRAEPARVARVSAPRGAASFLSPPFRPQSQKPSLTTRGSQGGAGPQGKLRPGTPTGACTVRTRIEIGARDPQHNAGARSSPGSGGVLWRTRVWAVPA